MMSYSVPWAIDVCRHRFTAIILVIIASAVIAVPVHAADKGNDHPKVEGTWFASGLYSLNIANNGYTYSRLGAMGGYIGKWGGYAKLDFALIGNRTPNVSAGFTRRVATFRTAGRLTPSTLHMYFGLGYGNNCHAIESTEHDHIYHPDGTVECIPGTDRTIKYWDSTSGILAETGLIFRYRHMTFTLGYSITADLVGAAFGTGDSANHAIMVAIGYCF